MVATPSSPPEIDEERIDQRVFLFSKSYDDYLALVKMRGESAVPRISYLEGTIEIMSPSSDHEEIKKLFARLLEAWADETETDLNSFGSWTLKRRAKERGAEPDECYIVGVERKKAPDVAIEVQWSRGGLNKLEIYRALDVREVWIWSDRRGVEVHSLRENGRYQRIPASEILPAVDLAEIGRLLHERPANHTKAVRAYRAALREKHR